MIYAVMPNGDLVWNRHLGRGSGTHDWAAPNGRKVGQGWAVRNVLSGASLTP